MRAPARTEPHPGNAYDKYGSANPLVRLLVGRFLAALDELVETAAPAELLDVGCGEGIVTERIATRLGPGARVTGLDRAAAPLRGEWERRRGIELVTGDARELPFADGAYDAVSLIESLQLVPEHRRALAEAARVARRWLIVTVPREPLWRVLNVARGAYLRELGDTPGHVHHFSRRAIARELAAHGELVALPSRLPWTLALVRLRRAGGSRSA